MAHLQRSRKKLLKRIHALACSKSHGRVSDGLIAKIALSVPSASARSFAQALTDLVGRGNAGVSRPTISSVRDAFAEVAKEVVHRVAMDHIREAASVFEDGFSTAASGARALRPVFCVALLHVQDEARLRLRSAEPADTAPARSRSSKVQQHALWMHVASIAAPLLTELDALADKTAATIATSLLATLRGVASSTASVLAEKLDARQTDLWFLHVLVGDGIGTNEAAARRVLAAVRRQPLAPGLRYMLMVVKCANHQANLVVGSAVHGLAAKIGFSTTAALINCPNPFESKRVAFTDPGPHTHVCGAIVRLFKYLVADYYHEFYAALRGHVETLQFLLQQPAGSRPEHWSRVAELYGEQVVPARVSFILNAGLDMWVHVVPPHDMDAYTQDAEMHRCIVREKLLEELRHVLLHVDEHPTLTRMFTFEGHVHKLLLVHFLGIFGNVFRLLSVLVYVIEEETEHDPRSCLRCCLPK